MNFLCTCDGQLLHGFASFAIFRKKLPKVEDKINVNILKYKNIS